MNEHADPEIGDSQAADRHAVGVGDRDDEGHRIAVADGGDALDDWSLCGCASGLNDQSPYRWTSFSTVPVVGC